MQGQRERSISVLLIIVMMMTMVPIFSFPSKSHADVATYSTPGTFSFNVPAYTTMTVQVWGGGGGGSHAGVTFGTDGGQSSFNSNVIGNGGARGTATGGAGGTASGGDTNTTGGSGSTNSSFTGGAGGNAPGGGGTGGGGGVAQQGVGTAGNAPGGGGGGGGGLNPALPPNQSAPGGSGGGSGGYSTKTYSPGDLTVGNNITVVVGSAGTGGTSTGAAGGAGRVVITYTPLVTTPPTVTTSAASGVSSSGATLNGSITDNGGANATQHGFAYSTNSTLSSGVSTSTLGGYSGTGSFNTSVGSLSPSTTYYFRAYATNSSGAGYGSIQSFVTIEAPNPRVIRLKGGVRLRGIRFGGTSPI